MRHPSLRNGPLGLQPWDQALADMDAPRLESVLPPADSATDEENADGLGPEAQVREHWIDIPISVREPVKVALICTFLGEQDIEFEESQRFVSVPITEAEKLMEHTVVWAFAPPMPDDNRHVDSLASTLREIGAEILSAIKTAACSDLAGLRHVSAALESAPGIDLRS